MSLLNIWTAPDSATIVTDTDGINADGQNRPLSKILAIAHLPAVLAFRGNGAFAVTVFQRCVLRGFETFDAMLEGLPKILEEVRLPESLQIGGVGNELAAVGWSRTMRCRLFVQQGAGFAISDSEGCIAPWVESMSHIPKELDHAAKLAKAQVEYMRNGFGVGGGKLIFCRVTKDAISMETTCQQ